MEGRSGDFCEASVSIPLMHNVARNTKQHIRYPCACPHGPNLRERGGHKKEAAQPLTTRHPVRGTHAVLCVGPRHSSLSVSGLGALYRSFWSPALSVSGPAPQIRVSPGPHTPSSDPRPRGLPAPIRMPPIPFAGPQLPPIRSAGPQLRSAATHPARRVPFFQERTPNLTVWGKSNNNSNGNGSSNSNSNFKRINKYGVIN